MAFVRGREANIQCPGAAGDPVSNKEKITILFAQSRHPLKPSSQFSSPGIYEAISN
jgi:hypothetical protein